MKKYFLLIAVVLLVAGCQQVRDDYNTGRNTPYAEGETTPQQKSSAIVSTVSVIPYANVAAPVLAIGLPFLFTYLRGRRIRKESLPVNDHPITGNIGLKIGAEAIVQNLANVAAGLFEVGPNGSVLKRGWKTTLLAGLGVAVAPVAQQIVASLIPVLQNNHPAWLTGTALALSIGGLGALEKWLSKVEPIAPKSPAVV